MTDQFTATAKPAYRSQVEAGDRFPGQVELVDRDFPRIKVRVEPIFQGAALPDIPWCYPELPFGARQNGGHWIPFEVNDWVWIRFHKGDTRYPIATSSIATYPDGSPMLPHEVWDGPSEHGYPTRADEPSVPDRDNYASYTYSHGNVLLELTPQGEARIINKQTGTRIEITQRGHVVVHGAENEPVVLTAPANFLITGDTRIDGNLTVTKNTEIWGKTTGHKAAAFNATMKVGASVTAGGSGSFGGTVSGPTGNFGSLKAGGLSVSGGASFGGRVRGLSSGDRIQIENAEFSGSSSFKGAPTFEDETIAKSLKVSDSLENEGETFFRKTVHSAGSIRARDVETSGRLSSNGDASFKRLYASDEAEFGAKMTAQSVYSREDVYAERNLSLGACILVNGEVICSSSGEGGGGGPLIGVLAVDESQIP